nr:MAG TPA: hypothetical protein [Caudoviricetes sp.]
MGSASISSKVLISSAIFYSPLFHSVIPHCVLQQKSQPPRKPQSLAPIALSRAQLRGS